jgi:DNA-binding CsgD family transcriptional regulator
MLDRERERHAVDDTLDLVRSGFSGRLVLRGGHGVGKTTLLDYALKSATGFETSSVVGVESEIDLEFAALHQLLIPFLPPVDELPAPQRDAIKVAFGLETGKPPNPFLVALGCLTLVSRAAEDHPVLCTVDDADWIDAESAQLIGFVARRLYADRVGIILTVGDTGPPAAFDQLPAIDLGALPDDAAAELLRSVVGERLTPPVVSRVLADTGRNPLALIEVGSEYGALGLSNRAQLPAPVRIGSRLEQRYLQTVRRLSRAAQEYVLLVAADGSGQRTLIRQAAADASIDLDAAEEAGEAAGLIEVSGDAVRFRHPLIRAAVYNGVTDASRRRAHRLLSEACAASGDNESRIWHLAAAAAGPDERVAAKLQAAAERASSRGAWTTAAGLLHRSIDLTTDPSRRAGREVGLARAELLIGKPDIAEQAASGALPELPDDVARGGAQALRGAAVFAQGHSGEAADILLQAAADLRSDPAAAADAMLSALDAATWSGSAATNRIASVVVPPPLPAGSAPRVSDLLLAGYRARFTEGYEAAVQPLRDGLKKLRAADLEPEVGLRWFRLGAIAAGSLWDDEAMIDISDRWERVARRLGAVTYLPVALVFRAFSDWLTGHFDEAADRWAEMRELMAANQGPDMFASETRTRGLVHAYRGEIAAARQSGLELIRQSTARGQGGIADIGRSVLVVANLFAGEPQAAIEAGSTVMEHDPAFTAEHTLPELAEAAFRSGDERTAGRAFARLDSRARASGTAWALGLRARTQALMNDGEQAEHAYLDSIRHLEHSRAKVDLARAHLYYGQWLRRGKRRREARDQLRIAESMFGAMGADGPAAEAKDELRATGERARSRTPETELELTPREHRVANLAAEGSTNGEIAAQLFISPSTVEYHLAKVYRKLGVKSRTQLAAKLPRHGSGRRVPAPRAPNIGLPGASTM